MIPWFKNCTRNKNRSFGSREIAFQSFRKWDFCKFFLEKVLFLKNKACISYTAFNYENWVHTGRKIGAKIEILRSWFLKFFDFLTKWLIFRYKSNENFCCLWPQKQPWYPFEGFKRPWFLTCIKKYENFSKKSQNCNFQTVCTSFFQFQTCKSIELFMFFRLSIVTKVAQVSLMNNHDFSRSKLLDFLVFWLF